METNGARGCYIWGAAAGAQLAPCHKESPSPAILAVLLCVLFILVGTPTVYNSVPFPGRPTLPGLELENNASLTQVAEERMVVGSIPTGALFAKPCNCGQWMAGESNPSHTHYLQQALGDGGGRRIVDHGFGVGLPTRQPYIIYKLAPRRIWHAHCLQFGTLSRSANAAWIGTWQ